MIKFILTAILLGILTACGTVGLEPNNNLVQKAIALQISLTQKQLTQQIYPSRRPQSDKFEVTRLVIKQQEPLVMQNLPTYRIQGTYNLNIQMPLGWVTQEQNPFEIYVQRQSEGKTWRLVIPQLTSKDNQPTWVTYLIR